jgi:hypothetical protein
MLSCVVEKNRQVAQQHDLRHSKIFKTSYRLKRQESSTVILLLIHKISDVKK